MQINIYQIYFKNEHLSLLEKSFIPYDNSKGDNEWYEYGVFKKEYETNPIYENEIRGYMSWKFAQKSQIPGQEFVQFIKDNPGYDVYFINPFYEETYFFKSVWECAEFYHPGISNMVRDLFRRLDYNIDIDKIVNDENSTLYCNFWAGNRAFWDQYINFTKPIYDAISRNMFPELTEKITGKAQYIVSASHIPFIMERMFSTLIVNPSFFSLKAKPYLFTPEQIKKRYYFQKPLLVPLKDLKEREIRGEETATEIKWRSAAREVRQIHLKSLQK